MKTIKAWADRWIVQFSPSKTCTMLCSLKKNLPNLDIYYDNINLTKTVNHKHLGLHFTQNLNWSYHISTILESVQNMSGLLKYLKYLVDRKSLETFYFIFIRPKLEYGSIVWSNCSGTDKNRLEDFQLEIARTVTGAKRGTSHDAIYSETGWPKLAARQQLCKLKTYSNMIQGTAPPYLCSLVTGKVGDNRPSSRQAENYIVPRYRTDLFGDSFIPSVIKSWNSIEPKDRNLPHFESTVCFAPNVLYNFGERFINIIHAQLRMKCSNLKAHLHLLHVVDSPSCQCGHNMEDNNHYLLKCPLYNTMRNKMFNIVSQYVPYANIDEYILLFGDNEISTENNLEIFKAVHSYIKGTARFQQHF